MNVAIFGDSFANGEIGNHNTAQKSHLGLTQYFTDDGHFVINFSKPGNWNEGILEDYRHFIFQNTHINFDLAIIFQTEISRQIDEWIERVDDGASVRDVEHDMSEDFLQRLKHWQIKTEVPVFLIGGCGDLIDVDLANKYGIKHVCQSLVNLVLNGNHEITEPVTSNVLTGNPTKVKSFERDIIDDKEYFLKLIEMGDLRKKQIKKNPKYFRNTLLNGDEGQDDIHPNREAYRVLYEYIMEQI
tara:strand:- start:239 stop:967 length:729 start_codon:yes stop_codon:yes gene_type:complete